MATARPRPDLTTVRFSWSEVTGAIGDTVTVLPIVVALVALTPVSLPHTLFAFGVFQVVWGLWYGVPMSVEPMKALAALAIAGTLSYAEFLSAGLLSGLALLMLGAGGGLARVEGLIGRPVVRGVQLAVALVLAETAVGLALGDPVFAGVGLAVAVGAVVLSRANVAALCVLGAGVGVAIAVGGLPNLTVPGVPQVSFGALTPTTGVLEGTLAQLAMTVGNAAVATSLLVSEYFDRDVSPDDLAASMGAMTLLSLPLGSVPMCHGSGGLAGKYAFGARTAGANLVLGTLYGVAALVAGGGFFTRFPMATLGVVLGLIAIELARSALRSESAVGVAFCLGIVGYWLARWFRSDDSGDERGPDGFSRRAADEGL